MGGDHPIEPLWQAWLECYPLRFHQWWAGEIAPPTKMSLNKKLLGKVPSEPSSGNRFLPPNEWNCCLKLHSEFCTQLSSTFSRWTESSEGHLRSDHYHSSPPLCPQFLFSPTLTFCFILVLKNCFTISLSLFFYLKWVVYKKDLINSEI